MKKLFPVALAACAALALGGCGKSESAKEQAQPDNVEMPAEETVQDVPGNATPVADASAASGAEAASSSAAK